MLWMTEKLAHNAISRSFECALTCENVKLGRAPWAHACLKSPRKAQKVEFDLSWWCLRCGKEASWILEYAMARERREGNE